MFPIYKIRFNKYQSLVGIISDPNNKIYYDCPAGHYQMVRNKKKFSYISTITYVEGTQKNRLIEKRILKLVSKKIFTLFDVLRYGTAYKL